MIVLFDMFGVIARDQSPDVMATMSAEPEFWDAYWAHRPAYDRQRPEPFALALRAAKNALDPHGVLNPGVLLDP